MNGITLSDEEGQYINCIFVYYIFTSHITRKAWKFQNVKNIPILLRFPPTQVFFSCASTQLQWYVPLQCFSFAIHPIRHFFWSRVWVLKEMNQH